MLREHPKDTALLRSEAALYESEAFAAANDVEGARKPLRVTLHLFFASNVLPRFLHFTPQDARAHSINCLYQLLVMSSAREF